MLSNYVWILVDTLELLGNGPAKLEGFICVIMVLHPVMSCYYPGYLGICTFLGIGNSVQAHFACVGEVDWTTLLIVS